MTFSKTPENSTYQTKKVPLIAEMNSRGILPTTDVDYVNCYPEMVKSKNTQEQYATLRKRLGSTLFTSLPSASIRGMYHWEDQSLVYVAVSSNIVVYNSATGALVTTLNNVFPTTTTGNVGIVEFLYDTGDVKLVVSDGTTLSTIDILNNIVPSADPDLQIHLPQIVFLDGYLFVVKVSSADLYNSNLNDPLSYTTGDFISSEMLPDRVTGLYKLNNYIVLFGNDSIEYFWDAANESGSPLQRNDTPVKLTGFVGGVAQLGNKIYFVGNNNNSQHDVFVLDDFKITALGNETIRRFLSHAGAGMFASIASIDGHDFYVLYIGLYTYVLEIADGIWTRWTYTTSSSFSMTFACNYKVGSSYFSLFTLNGVAAVYTFSPSLYQDSGSTITATGVTNNERFDTHNRKQMHRLSIVADRTTGSNPILVQWTDDDYQTYNTGITVELNQDLPSINRLGTFRRRAFKFTHTANKPLRIFEVETDINLGQT